MTVPGWQELRSERIELYSPLGLRLIDDFTTRAPIGRITVMLDRQVPPAAWEPTDIKSVITPSNVVTWPGLGRKREPKLAPVRRYRVHVTADLYRPDYLQSADGIEFDAPPWDDDNPPAPMTMGPQDVYLFPSTSYDFPTWVSVLRGVVEDASGAPISNVLVHQAGVERVLTDERGSFSLPLRWATTGLSVDAIDQRTGRAGTHVLTLPADLRSSLTITIV